MPPEKTRCGILTMYRLNEEGLPEGEPIEIGLGTIDLPGIDLGETKDTNQMQGGYSYEGLQGELELEFELNPWQAARLFPPEFGFWAWRTLGLMKKAKNKQGGSL